MNKKAFTLIELLVVVLIIGILAAIALPQYEKAVDKARMMTVINMVKAIKDAQEVYYLANGQYATDFSDLDVSFPEGNLIKSDAVTRKYDNGPKYFMWVEDDKSQSIYGYPAGFDYKVGIEWYLDHHTEYPEYPGEWISCVGRNERGHKLCQALGGVLWDQSGDDNINKYYKITF